MGVRRLQDLGCLERARRKAAYRSVVPDVQHVKSVRFNGYYDFFKSFEENQQRGQVPPPQYFGAAATAPPSRA
jgi:hypothetical protein